MGQQTNHNPVVIYVNNLLEILNKNSDISWTPVSAKYFFLKKKIISNYMINFLLDYNFYHQNKYHLWGDIEEYNNRLIIQDQLIMGQQLPEKFQNIYKEFVGDINGFNPGNAENLLETLLSQYYFSIYTQKFLFSQGVIMFLSREEATKIHNLVYTFNLYYPESKYLQHLKIITIIAYYESLSPLLFQNNFDIVFNILSLVDSLDPDDMKDDHNKLMEKILDNTKFIQYQKEMYKALILINNGQVAMGFNLLENELFKYKKLLYKPMEIFSPREYNGLNQPSQRIQKAYMFLGHRDNQWIFDTLNYRNIHHRVHYSMAMAQEHWNLPSIITMDMVQKTIEQSPQYKIYQLYKKKYDGLKKQIQG
jgi:hypothetical protein